MFQIVTAAPRTLTSRLAASAALHTAIIVALFTLSFSGAPAKLPSRPLHVTLIAPARDPLPHASRPVPLSAPRLAVRVFVAPKPTAATLTAPPQPKLVLDPPPPPAPETARLQAPAPVELPRVAPPVKTGTFSEPLAAPAPATTPSLIAKPAGFTPAETATAKPARSLLTTGGNFDAAFPQSGSRRASLPGSAPTHTVGFGEANATTGAAPVRASANLKGTFGDASTTAPSAHSAPPGPLSASTPVEILEKPRPAYTEEARRLSLEGEVLLEVSFTASGEARVLRTVRALGHGLDESAASAARSIRFRPARRGGVAIDSTAVVHIVFQLAY